MIGNAVGTFIKALQQKPKENPAQKKALEDQYQQTLKSMEQGSESTKQQEDSMKSLKERMEALGKAEQEDAQPEPPRRRNTCRQLQDELSQAERDIQAARDKVVKYTRLLEEESDPATTAEHLIQSRQNALHAARIDHEIFQCGKEEINKLLRRCERDGTDSPEISSLLEIAEHERAENAKYHRFLQKVMLWFNVRSTKPTAPGYYYPVLERIPKKAMDLDSKLAMLSRRLADNRKGLYDEVRERSQDEYGALHRAAFQEGIFVPVAGQKEAQVENDCVVWAIAHGAGVPYDDVRGIAEEAIRYAEGEKRGERLIRYTGTQTRCMNQRPQLRLRFKGMRADQTVMTAVQYGAIQSVVLSDFAKALAQTGRPIVTRIDVGGGHAIVVNGVFEYKKNIYIATVDSNLGDQVSENNVFWEAEKFAKVLTGEGFIIYPRGYLQKR
ncbi:MAG: hypothetical protein HY922_10865 [Elusimicrobia bacterium]|nr:hypothetical protein [Elusimicrobiota bacterium]